MCFSFHLNQVITLELYLCRASNILKYSVKGGARFVCVQMRWRLYDWKGIFMLFKLN